MRARLSQLLHLFLLNAAELFDDVHKKPAEPLWRSTRSRVKGKRATAEKIRPTLAIKSDPEAMPDELELLADDLNTFVECLNQIPEFNDEAVNAYVVSFQNDLKYWSSCLRDFEGDERTKPGDSLNV